MFVNTQERIQTMNIDGNAIVGQSGGPTAAINASLSGVIRGAAELHAAGAIKRLYGMRYGVEGLLSGRITDLTGLFGDERSLSLLEQTPASALGSCRMKLPEPDATNEIYLTLLEVLRAHDIRFFFYIGGNDSMDTVDKLTQFSALVGYELRVIGVPKTIDNDLCETDHTPGFGSAAKFIANTTAEILCDSAVYDLPAVTVLEIMGRDTGWLTCAAGIADASGGRGPDLIYLPERIFSGEAFLSDIRRCFSDHKSVVVAVSEGIHTADGTLIGEAKTQGSVDAFGHKSLSGAAKQVAALAQSALGCKARGIELNTLQRCASHLASQTDIAEAVACGKAAVRLAAAGETGCTVIIRRTGENPYTVTYDKAEVRKIANRVKYVPDAFIGKDGCSITEACRRYLLPLIAGESSTPLINGVVQHFIIK